MKTHRLSFLIACLLPACLLTACGGGGGGGGSSIGAASTTTSSISAPSEPNSYFPLGAGDRWVYQESTDGTTNTYQVDVGETKTIDGKDITTVVTTTFAGEQLDVSRFSSTGLGVTEYPTEGRAVEQAVGTYTLFQLPAQDGDSFTQLNKTIDYGEDVDGDGKTEQMMLFSTVQTLAHDQMTTPAGTFSDAVHVRTTLKETVIFSASGQRGFTDVVIDDWYAPNVGLVRSDVTVSQGGQVNSRTSKVLLAYRTGGTHGGGAPTVVSVTPADATKTYTGAVTINATFSMPMDAASLNNGGLTVVDSKNLRVNGTVVLSADGLSATFVPTNAWASGAYLATVTSDGTDRQGNSAKPASWSFKLDAVSPTIALASAPDGSVVSGNSKLTYVFSEQLDPGSAMRAEPQITLTDNDTGESAPAWMSFDGVATYTFTPRTYWPHGHSYTLTFPSILADLAGNNLGADIKVHLSTSQGFFADPQPISTSLGRQPTMVIDDIDGDGLPDLVWAAWGDSIPLQMHLFMRRGQADGTWGSTKELLANSLSPCAVYSIGVGDVNRDGRKDLVLSGCTNRILLQNSSGDFVAGAVYAFSGYDFGLVVKLVDLNGDGRLDMLSIGNSTGVRVSMQDSSGTFVQTALIETGLGALDILETADLNGDGVMDMVVGAGGSQSEKLAVMYGIKGGGFEQPLVLPTDSGMPSGVAIYDMDGDGLLDLTVAIPTGLTSNPARVVVYRQLPDHHFAVSSTIPVAAEPNGVSLVDVNGDGRLDLVVGHGDAFGVLPRLPDGSFGPEDLYGVPLLDGLNSAMAVGPRDAKGRAVVAFNGLLFLPRSAVATPSQASGIQRPARLLSNVGKMLPSATR